MRAGIGDQLSQLQRLYNLGRLLGLEYLHRKPPVSRWAPDFDAWDFLGIDVNELHYQDFQHLRVKSLDAYQVALHVKRGGECKDLTEATEDPAEILELVHSAKLYSSHPDNPQVPVRYSLDLRSKFFERHPELKNQPKLSPRICAHIRLGDCTWVKFKKRFLFIGMAKIAQSASDVDIIRAPSIETIKQLILRAARDGGLENPELSIYSDGPASCYAAPIPVLSWLATRLVLIFPNLLKLRIFTFLYNPLTLPKVAEDYQKIGRDLESLKQLPNFAKISLNIGQSAQLTEKCIRDFALCDIAIVGRGATQFPLLGLHDSSHCQIFRPKDLI